MDRRNFLKQASGYALAAAGTMTGIGQVFASAMPAKEDRTNGYSDNLKQNKDMEHRNLGGMEVSAIGLGCLPMEVTLEDYNNGTEKIFYPDPELSLDDTPRGCAPVAGDITIYEPWGNVAIFCRDWSESNSLIKIGHIDGDGISLLQGPESVNVRFERQ